MLLYIYEGLQHLKFNPNFEIIPNNYKGRMFYCALYNNEAAMLYITLWRMFEYVDYFLIMYSNISFSGKSKEVFFTPFEPEIKLYQDKIIYINIDHFMCNHDKYPRDGPPFCFEKTMRQYFIQYIEENFQPNGNDLIYISDIDEIITRPGIHYIREHPPDTYYVIHAAMYHLFYFHESVKANWYRNFVLRYSKNMPDATWIRNYGWSRKDHYINYSLAYVTHCTYCFESLEQYRNKLQTFAHTNFDDPKYTNPNYIFKNHYCRVTVHGQEDGEDQPFGNLEELIPDDKRLKFLYDPSFEFPLNLTTYKEEDLPKLCRRKYRRKMPEDIFYPTDLI